MVVDGDNNGRVMRNDRRLFNASMQMRVIKKCRGEEAWRKTVKKRSKVQVEELSCTAQPVVARERSGALACTCVSAMIYTVRGFRTYPRACVSECVRAHMTFCEAR